MKRTGDSVAGRWWNRGALALVGLACAAGLAAAQEPTPAPTTQGDSAVLIQESNGFPGGEKKAAQLARQEVWIDGDRLRIIDRQNQYGMFVDLEAKQVIETDFRSRIYHQRPFSYYEKYSRDRKKALADQRDEFVRGAERRSGKELEEWRAEYRKIGGDPDQPGRLRATVKHHPEDKEQVELRVDGEPKTVTLEHYTVHENQAELPIFDVYLTTDVELPVDLVRFYSAIGTFSDAVTKALVGLKGTVIRCDAVLDTGTFHRVFRTRILELREGDARGSSSFDIAKMREIKWLTEEEWKAQQEKAQPQGPTPKCAMCGKEIEGKGTSFKSPFGRETYLLDSDACRKALIKKLIAERKKKR